MKPLLRIRRVLAVGPQVSAFSGRKPGGDRDRSESHFSRYPATRESANRIDIKITITPVAKASLSANTRRIGTSLDEAIAFRMVFRHRHAHLAEGFFNCIHHHAGPADEVLMIGIRWRQMTLEHLSVDETLFTRPAGRGVRQHMNDRQVEPRFQHLQLLAE